MRGYFGVGIYQWMHGCNVGTLFRTAYAMGADFIYTVGRPYTRQSSDTVNSGAHVPLYNHATYEDFKKNLPSGCRIVAVELTDDAHELPQFCHPERAVYLLGREAGGIPQKILADPSVLVVKIPSRVCLNVGVAGSIVLYDRVAKAGK